jgi:hypothetical protein
MEVVALIVFIAVLGVAAKMGFREGQSQLLSLPTTRRFLKFNSAYLTQTSER